MRIRQSTISVFQRCPLQAKFAFRDLMPQPQHAKASFGTVVHHALELYNTHNCDLELALDAFKTNWDHPELLGVKPDFWPKNATYGGLRNMGIECITNYHESVKWEERDILACEHRFLVPFGDHELEGTVDLLEVRKNGKGKPILRVCDLKTNARQPTKTSLRYNIQFCADEQTEVLTRSGWRKHSELKVGDEVLTYHQESDSAEWQPVSAVNTFHAHDQEMLSMESVGHSSLTTLNHRWYVERTSNSHKRGWWRSKMIVTSSDLDGNRDRIPCAAAVNNLPTRKTWSDDFVELVAWYWTEGTLRQGVDSGVAISQSPSANPQHEKRIRELLTRMFGAANGGPMHAWIDSPAWTDVGAEDCTRFYLNRHAARDLRRVVEGKNKIVRYDFVASLTRDQLALFVDVSIFGDVHERSGCRDINQSVRERLEPLQMACTLLGIRTSLNYRPVRGNGKYAGRNNWHLVLHERRRFFTPKGRDRGFQKKIVRYTGNVWCPTTPNGTWLARRNGQVYFTGNTTYIFATLQREFWLGNGPDYPPMQDGERLWEELQNVERRGIWIQLCPTRWRDDAPTRLVKEIEAGERTDEDFMRLYRIVLEIEKALKYDVFIPDISADTCPICPYTEQCGIVIPKEDKSRIDEEGWY